jgi:hypothetical protein
VHREIVCICISMKYTYQLQSRQKSRWCEAEACSISTRDAVGGGEYRVDADCKVESSIA